MRALVPYTTEFFPFAQAQTPIQQLAFPQIYTPTFTPSGIGAPVDWRLPEITDLQQIYVRPEPDDLPAPQNDADGGCGIFGCDPFGYGKGCGIFGCNPLSDSGYLGITEIVRKYSLLLFAGALILLGVYLMARSTPEGKTVLRVASGGAL